MYSRNNAKCSLKIMQNVAENEWKMDSNATCSPKIMKNAVQIW